MICKNCGKEIDNKAVVCVNCGSKVKAKKPFYKKWWFWVIAVVLIAVIGSAAGGGDNAGTTSQTDPAITYEVVDLKTMIDDLENNALKAEKTYQNKYVEIKGNISNFDSDGEYISIEPINSDAFSITSVMCYINNDSQLDFLLEKSVGDTITIKGKITSVGEVLGYSIKIDEVK